MKTRTVPVRKYVRRRDPYKVLGVKPDASKEHIKAKYRALVKRLHPDVTGGDKKKEERLKEVNVAYEQLVEKKGPEALFVAPGGIDVTAAYQSYVDLSPEMVETLQAKLNPRRFPGLSSQMAAIIDHIVTVEGVPSAKHTDPQIVSLTITSDGFVLGHDSRGRSIFIGSVDDLSRNLSRLANAAELTKEETRAFKTLAEWNVAGLQLDWKWED